MCDQVGLRARRDNLYATVIAITIKTSKFRDYSHQKKIINATNNTMEIYKVILELFDLISKTEKVRNIGVRLSNFQTVKKEQISLFEQSNNQDNDKVQKMVDDINQKYKNTTIMPAIFYTE